MIYPIELLKRHLMSLDKQMQSIHLLDASATPMDLENIKNEMADKMIEVEVAISVLEVELSDSPELEEDEVVD